jgi:hypothetical protein
MTHSIIYFLILSVLLFAGCATHSAKTIEQVVTDSGSVLWFEEKRKNEPAGVVRMLVTKDYLRIDSGKDQDDFLLFDRNRQIIYNVVVDDETIMEIDNRSAHIGIGHEFEWRVEEAKSHAVAGRGGQNQSRFHRYLVNGQDCRSVVSVEGLLPEALQALKEYRQILSRELAKGLQYQPSQDICYVAINIADPSRHLQKGFPIREWDKSGYQRFLQDYQLGIVIPRHLFELPTDYNRYALK